jgi:hypothetical protein
MPLYSSLHNLLNVLVEIANGMGFKKSGASKFVVENNHTRRAK